MNIQDGPSWAHLSLHRPYGLSLRRPSSAPSRTASTLSRSAVSCQHHLDVSPTNLRVGLAGPPGLKMEIPQIPTTEPELILMPAPPKYLYYWRHLFIVTYIYSLIFSDFFLQFSWCTVPVVYLRLRALLREVRPDSWHREDHLLLLLSSNKKSKSQWIEPRSSRAPADWGRRRACTKHAVAQKEAWTSNCFTTVLKQLNST